MSILKINKSRLSEENLDDLKSNYNVINEDKQSIYVELKEKDLEPFKTLYNALVEINE